MDKTMKSPLIIDLQDHKWYLLKKVINLLNTRRINQEISKSGIKPLNFARDYLIIIFIAMFFSFDITYILEEMKRRPDLRKFLGVRKIPPADKIYRFSSQFSEDQFVDLTWGILNSLCADNHSKESRTIIIDGTALAIDLNWFRRKYSKNYLESLPYSWGYSPSKGYYIGYKLTLAIDEKTMMPLAFLLHPGSPSDSKIFSEIIHELSRRRILKEGDAVLLDRGYYSYENYIDALLKYRILPLIIPKKNLNFDKLKNRLIFPLNWYYSTRGPEYINVVQKLAKKLMQFLSEPYEWILLRTKIEDLFKFGKKALGWDRLHCYTRKSIGKTVILNALLLGLLLNVDSRLKNSLKRASEW